MGLVHCPRLMPGVYHWVALKSISLSFEHSDEDQWLCGGNVLDLTNIRVGSTSERELRTHT